MEILGLDGSDYTFSVPVETTEEVVWTQEALVAREALLASRITEAQARVVALQAEHEQIEDMLELIDSYTP